MRVGAVAVRFQGSIIDPLIQLYLFDDVLFGPLSPFTGEKSRNVHTVFCDLSLATSAEGTRKQ